MYLGILANLTILLGSVYSVVAIIGGSDASEGQIPWEVSIRGAGSHFAGGSILNRRWILTTGHSLVGAPAWDLTIVANTLLLNASGDVYQVNQTMIHPDFNATLLSNDVGLIQLTSDIIYSTNVQPAQLPSADFTAVDYPAVQSGWGMTSYPGEFANHLQYLNTTIVSQEVCRNASSRASDTNICTFSRIGEGGCYGDSGSPLTADGIVVGIVSFGETCALGTPDIFTRIWSFLPWIKSNIGWQDNDNARQDHLHDEMPKEAPPRRREQSMKMM